MHWHGIALEDSYYDGGAGMGMSMPGGRMSPAIEPGQTFVARFVPPDAGTFTYHSHVDDGWQNAGGLVGPLIVLPRGQRFDARTDHIVMISESFEKAGGPPLAINGHALTTTADRYRRRAAAPALCRPDAWRRKTSSSRSRTGRTR